MVALFNRVNSNEHHRMSRKIWENYISKILIGTEMAQNKKRSLNPWFSTYRKQAKKTHLQNMLPVMKKGRMNQRVKPRAQRMEPKVMEKVWSHSRFWNPIKELSVFVWGDPRTALDWELLCDSHFPPVFELKCLWQFSYAGPNIICWMCGVRWLVSLVSWVTGKQILHSRSCTWVVCGEPHSHQGFLGPLEAGRKVWNRASRNNHTCQ